MEKINLTDKFALFNDLWSPKIVGNLNDCYIKLAKFKGEFIIIPKGVEPLPIAEEEASVMSLNAYAALSMMGIVSTRMLWQAIMQHKWSHHKSAAPGKLAAVVYEGTIV